MAGSCAFAKENVYAVVLVHLRIEAFDLRFHVDLHFRHPDGIDIPAKLVEECVGEPVILVEALMIIVGGAGREPAAVATHDLVDDELARTRGVFVRDVAEEACALVSGGPGPESLFDRVDVVVDRLRETDDGELVAVLVKVVGEISGRSVGIVSADGVEDVDLVRLKALSCDLERDFPRLHKATLGAVVYVGEFDPAVPDGAAAEVVENGCIITNLLREMIGIPEKETLIPVQVTHQISIGREGVVLFDQASNGSGKTWGDPPGGQKGNSHQVR